MFDINDLEFKRLDLEGVVTLVEWAEQQGWNPGPNDAKVYYNTDPDGFYGIFYNNELIGGGSIVSYNNEFGFMGFFIIKPEYRGDGIGRKLWYLRRDTLLSRLDKGAPIGMDGVVDMQPFYKKGGFEILFRDERHEKIGKFYEVSPHVSAILTADHNSILQYDKQCFGFSRTKFLIPWLNLPGNRNFKYVVNKKLKGFAIVRKANKGYKICPLFADTPEVAEELYKACLNSVIGEPLYLDIPMSNKAAIDLTKKYKTKYVFECARMYYGNPPKVELEKIFGITTFELG